MENKTKHSKVFLTRANVRVQVQEQVQVMHSSIHTFMLFPNFSKTKSFRMVYGTK